MTTIRYFQKEKEAIDFMDRRNIKVEGYRTVFNQDGIKLWQVKYNERNETKEVMGRY